MIDDLGRARVNAALIGRKEAALRGLKRFYTGIVCKDGHLAERLVSNGQCVVCNARAARRREADRSASDPAYRLYRNAQRRAGQLLRGRASPSASIACSPQRLAEHIERQFTLGMAWANYRQWEVDHIVPLSAARTEEDLVELCRYTNLQPLWRRQNRMKGGA